MGFEGDLGLQAASHLADSSFLSTVSSQGRDPSDELDLSFLPDDLSAQDGPPPGINESQDSGINVDCPPGVEDRSDADKAPTGASPFCPRPMTPMTPITPMTPVSESSGIVPQLQNIVSTVNLACPLDLKSIALQARNAEYNPKRFAAVIMRIREPRTTALIFSSGKMVCTGAKSYEPELFPGLIYRMVKPRIVLLIFVSGKVVLTGAKERSEIYEAFENIYPILKGFRKQ